MHIDIYLLIFALKFLSACLRISIYLKMCCKVMSTIPSCLEAHAGFFRSTCWLFQIVDEGEILCLFTVTFWGKDDFHIVKEH